MKFRFLFIAAAVVGMTLIACDDSTVPTSPQAVPTKDTLSTKMDSTADTSSAKSDSTGDTAATKTDSTALAQKVKPPVLSLDSGLVAWGTVVSVKAADKGDEIHYGTDSTRWKSLYSPYSVEVGKDTVFYFRSFRDGKSSQIIRASFRVKLQGPGVEIAGRKYRTVAIAGMHWMAENLDVGTMIRHDSAQKNDKAIEKYCHGDSLSNCDSTGGLYQFSEALALPSACNVSFCQNFFSMSSRGLCPEGWHVSSFGEWNNLSSAVGGWKNLYAASGWDIAYPDPYGFGLKPNDRRGVNGKGTVSFWLADVFADQGTILYGDGSKTTFWGKSTAAAVRCVQ